MSFAPFAFYVQLCIFPKLQSVMLPFTYVCFWKCCTSIEALFLFTKFHNTKLRTVPHGTVRKVLLVCIFITRTNVPYPYLSNNYVPYYLPKNGAYCTCVPYRTAILDCNALFYGLLDYYLLHKLTKVLYAAVRFICSFKFSQRRCHFKFSQCYRS